LSFLFENEGVVGSINQEKRRKKKVTNGGQRKTNDSYRRKMVLELVHYLSLFKRDFN
jgi:hypothetical protein